MEEESGRSPLKVVAPALAVLRLEVSLAKVRYHSLDTSATRR